ncbi:MAG: hypothetical protein NVSMB56_06280 [Pyrinomonadaceae bacterium]
MLLAAGRGTRLYPLTETVPKCMMPVAGKPVLEHTLCWLRDYGVTEFVINLHRLPEKVTKHFGDGERFGVNIAYTHETELLGTAGAVRNAAAYFGDTTFFVWYGDNLGRCGMDKLWATHEAGQGVVTIALHWREDPTQSGIVGFDDEGRIRRFLEKPRAEEVFSNWVSAGVLVVEPEILEMIKVLPNVQTTKRSI